MEPGRPLEGCHLLGNKVLKRVGQVAAAEGAAERVEAAATAAVRVKEVVRVAGIWVAAGDEVVVVLVMTTMFSTKRYFSKR